jgi:hypothetical protein
VLATADDEMQDRWIPDEEWVRHIRSKEYLKSCMVTNLNYGINKRFQFSNDRYECPFAKRVLYFRNRHSVTVSPGTKKNICFYYCLSTQNKEIPEISNRLDPNPNPNRKKAPTKKSVAKKAAPAKEVAAKKSVAKNT